MNADPQAQLLAQNQKLERLENRICGFQRDLEILLSGPKWVERHAGWIVAVVFAFVAGAVACCAIS